MDWLKLPAPRADIPLAFADPNSAKAWLAAQPQAQALHMLTMLCQQVEAIEGTPMPAMQTLALLAPLWSATIPIQNSVEARYARKPLPLPEEDERIFDAAQRLWMRLGIAHLRIAPGLTTAQRLHALHRAANALRLAQYSHFIAARSCPIECTHLLFGVLALAKGCALLDKPLADPSLPNLGEAHISGLIAWAFLLGNSDPYRLSAAQLIVANRALSRWRELATFIDAPPTEAQARVLDLSKLFGGPLPSGIPPLLEVRKVRRKMLQRVESLQNGESPESLKLGRELSGHACIRLLRALEGSLKQADRRIATEVGEMEIAFGAENAFAIFNEDYLNPPTTQDKKSSAIAHQRMAIFGFDRLSSLPSAIKKLTVPSETWTMLDGLAIRSPERDGERRASPCLIAAKIRDRARLGVLGALQLRADRGLQASLDWYDGQIHARFVRQARAPGETPTRYPVFLMQLEKERFLLLPPQLRITPGDTLTIEGGAPVSAKLGEVIERGADFVRYAIQQSH